MQVTSVLLRVAKNNMNLLQRHKVYDEMPFPCQAVCAKVSRSFRKRKQLTGYQDLWTRKKREIFLRERHVTVPSYFLAVCCMQISLDLYI